MGGNDVGGPPIGSLPTPQINGGFDKGFEPRVPKPLLMDDYFFGHVSSTPLKSSNVMGRARTLSILLPVEKKRT